MLRSRIKSIIHTFTTNELKIVDFINSTKIDTRTLTSTKLAKQLEVSQSTVIRFIQKIGYKSFREFLADLNTYILSSAENNNGVYVDESTSSTNQRMYNQYMDVLKITHQYNKTKEIEQVTKIIRGSRRIVVFGISNSGLVAHYIANQLSKFAIFASYDPDYHNTLVNITALNNDDLVILISESGETMEILKAATASRIAKAKIVSITGSIRNSLYSHSDVVLPTIIFESENRANLLTVFVSQLFVADMLLVNLLKVDYSRYLAHVEQSDKIVKSVI